MVEHKILGTAWCFGDNINTDLIFPGRYLSINDPAEMGKYALAGVDEKFSSKVKNGDIIVAGIDFGCGSSREQAAIAIKKVGITVIIARSFARIFYRNIINQGVLALISKDASALVSSGDEIELDLKNNILLNKTTNKTCEFEPLPEFILEIVEAGGIIQHLNKKLEMLKYDQDKLEIV